MKNSIILFSFLAATASFGLGRVHATGTPSALPSPTPSDAVSDSGVAMIQMMAENSAGLELFKKAHRNGPIIESAKVEILKQPGSTPVNAPETTQVTRYTVLSTDCLGTDACEGEYRWTVIGTLKSEGYTYTTHFDNEVVKVVPPKSR